MAERFPLHFSLALCLWAASLCPASLAASRLEGGRPAEGFADVVDRTLPAVVRVVVKRDALATARRSTGEASGVLIAADGYILTNHHVIDSARAITVQLSDEREFPARLVASDPQTDLAVLKIEANRLPSLTFADSSRVRVGDLVLAIGNPFGIGVTVTSGIVSARGRAASGFEDYIQTDAAINPGNSGGPLVNGEGEMIGINTAIVSPSGGSSGVGLAIPASVVRSVASDLIVHGKVSRGYLGVGLQPMTEALAEALGLADAGGALIADVAPDSPAARAGLPKGAVVVAIDGHAIRSFERLRLQIAEARPGVTVNLRVLSPEGEKTYPVTLVERPENVTAGAAEEQLAGGAVVAQTALPGGRAGVLMLALDPAGQFAEAGLRVGDVIAAVNRKPVTSVAGMKSAIHQAPARSVLVEISRQGSAYFVALPRSDN
ncbi:MAG: trypsin-like peptidase domain-containing protein [Bryobacteraceae bacterium]|nr:trypsin-like peptidase domain-containing protein [Bryobacteraceae bacterium]